MTILANNIQRRCERSVITAYQELKSAGVDEVQVFKSCTNLYRIYHPESSITEARLLVSEWIDHYFYNVSDGGTRGCNCAEASGNLKH
ncbi:unnamed protein product [Commensalibacter communis]|uniref:Uncharacterized protein n=1 Tax=Commensalibacter communis TaxID=2972786 RepID=A0A9W4TLL9_9PROT|nr:hypothetical protein [Commensalibacter communis]CAI3922696.1 unnamed protein product [Commensalibacter communis]CAI3924061.1 unnamed protein product [Commensalibacter communis]CAI3924134.1 unnamed protein product [Commensalibacter communis]CAI3924376.1 unnamed protein product [Commensalibacter communis]CAI3925032.1 unnamed protein product [Commensalibacter communis]